MLFNDAWSHKGHSAGVVIVTVDVGLLRKDILNDLHVG